MHDGGRVERDPSNIGQGESWNTYTMLSFSHSLHWNITNVWLRHTAKYKYYLENKLLSVDVFKFRIALHMTMGNVTGKNSKNINISDDSSRERSIKTRLYMYFIITI